MRKAIDCLLSAALFWGVWSLEPLKAAEEKTPAQPVAVVCFSGYNELKSDLDYLGQLAGRPQLCDALDKIVNTFTGGRGLAGLDKQQPWGMAIYLNPEEVDAENVNWAKAAFPVLFVPVTDVEALADSVQPMLGDPEEVEANIYRLEDQVRHTPVFARPEGPWVFFSSHSQHLADVPEDPQKLLGNLPKQYDLALQIRPGSMTKEVRRKLIARLHKNWSDEHREAVAAHADQVDRVTLGIALKKNGKTYVEAALAARRDSELAKQLAEPAEAQTRFSGFLGIEATLKANWVCHRGPQDAQQAGAYLDRVYEQASNRTEERLGEHAAVGKAILDVMASLARSFVSAGTMDGGLAVALKPDAVTAVIGGKIGDRFELENRLTAAADSLRSEASEFAELTVDADQHQGVNLHVAEVSIPEGAPNRQRLVSLLGEKLTVIVGVGDQSAYLAVGKEAAATLKAVIDRSQEAKSAAPLQGSLDLGSLMEFMGQCAPQENVRLRAQRLAEVLVKSDNADQLSAVARPTKRGMRLRLEIGEGALKAAAARPNAEP